MGIKEIEWSGGSREEFAKGEREDARGERERKERGSGRGEDEN